MRAHHLLNIASLSVGVLSAQICPRGTACKTVNPPSTLWLPQTSILGISSGRLSSPIRRAIGPHDRCHDYVARWREPCYLLFRCQRSIFHGNTYRSFFCISKPSHLSQYNLGGIWRIIIFLTWCCHRDGTYDTLPPFFYAISTLYTIHFISSLRVFFSISTIANIPNNQMGKYVAFVQCLAPYGKLLWNYFGRNPLGLFERPSEAIFINSSRLLREDFPISDIASQKKVRFKLIWQTKQKKNGWWNWSVTQPGYIHPIYTTRSALRSEGHLQPVPSNVRKWGAMATALPYSDVTAHYMNLMKVLKAYVDCENI